MTQHMMVANWMTLANALIWLAAKRPAALAEKLEAARKRA